MSQITRQDRINLHKKQERTQSSIGEQDLNSLKEGVSVIKQTEEGIIEYVKVNNTITQKRISPSAAIKEIQDRTGATLTKNAIVNTSGLANNSSSSTAVTTVDYVEQSLATLVYKINEIIKTLREQKLIG